MGYILLLILSVAAVVVLAAAFMGGRKRPTGRVAPRNDVTHKTPSADAPTPGASSTASQSDADAAQRHTPPA